MATKSSKPKSSSRSGSKSSTSSRGTGTRKTTSRKPASPQPSAFELKLGPEHQRELFALSLLTIALATLIFFITDSVGGVGAFYIETVQKAFGQGALVVPLALGVLGIAILVQERFQDAKLTGNNILGTILVLIGVLGMLEFPIERAGPQEQIGSGGGIVGYVLVNLLSAALGRPVTFLIICMIALFGLLLTFNLTLRELLIGTRNFFLELWFVVWSGPRRPIEAEQISVIEPKRARSSSEPRPYLPPPGSADNPFDDDDEIIVTPVAERPTRKSLFQRPEGSPELAHKEKAELQVASKAEKPSKAKASKAEKVSKVESLEPAIVAPIAAADPITETVQEALDGIGTPAIYRAWPLPTVEVLDKYVAGSISDEEKRNKARLIEQTLANFKVEAQVVGVNTGPAVTQFELQPAMGVKISKITTLEKDLALALAAHSIRIEAPIPGKGVVGIEIPNSAIALVSMREVIDSEEFDTSKAKLKLPLGKDVSGLPVVADMARMPHLLVAGSTGSGKSAAINAYLCGLLLRHSPDDLKLIMVDPKMVELIIYNDVPHLLSPVVTELERVVPTLKWATREMERRYKVFAKHACRNIDTYRQLSRRRADLEPMPYIVIVIDELADLMMMAPDEVETQICRLAQMARATGIHLIIATQRPSVDVITGLIKANFPSRIAFAVTSQIDSRVIIDSPGAEQLLGRGDMLYMAADAAKLVRIQGTWVSEGEVERIVQFWRSAKRPETPEGQADAQTSAAAAVPAAAKSLNGNGASDASFTPKADKPPGRNYSSEAANGASLAYTPPAEFLDKDEQDELLPQAITLVKQHKRASASLLQRRMRIGYSKAAQLIELLEQEGVVGPAEGGRSREVIGNEDL